MSAFDRVSIFVKRSFNSAFVLAGTGGKYSHIGVWNPVGSGVVAAVSRLLFSPTASARCSVRLYTVALANVATARNKFLGAPAGVCIPQYEDSVAFLGGQALYNLEGVAGQTVMLPLPEPLIVPAGCGVLVMAQTAAVGLSGAIEWAEFDA